MRRSALALVSATVTRPALLSVVWMVEMEVPPVLDRVAPESLLMTAAPPPPHGSTKSSVSRLMWPPEAFSSTLLPNTHHRLPTATVPLLRILPAPKLGWLVTARVAPLATTTVPLAPRLPPPCQLKGVAVTLRVSDAEAPART